MTWSQDVCSNRTSHLDLPARVIVPFNIPPKGGKNVKIIPQIVLFLLTILPWPVESGLYSSTCSTNLFPCCRVTSDYSVTCQSPELQNFCKRI